MSYGYQWLRCDSAGSTCVGIANATTATYLVASSDIGATLRSQVTATDGFGSATATSGPTAQVTGPDTPGQTMSRFGMSDGAVAHSGYFDERWK